MKRNTSNWSNFGMLLRRAGLTASAGLSCILSRAMHCIGQTTKENIASVPVIRWCRCIDVMASLRSAHWPSDDVTSFCTVVRCHAFRTNAIT